MADRPLGGPAGALEAGGEWTPSQKRLALDLLGTPKEFRDGPSVLDGDRHALIAEQVARLKLKIAEGMADLDEYDRVEAQDGHGRDLDRPLALVRRYEAANVRRMEQARKQIGKGRPAGTASPASRVVSPPPAPIAPPVPAAPLPVAVRDDRPVPNRKARRALKAMARRG